VHGKKKGALNDHKGQPKSDGGKREAARTWTTGSRDAGALEEQKRNQTEESADNLCRERQSGNADRRLSWGWGFFFSFTLKSLVYAKRRVLLEELNVSLGGRAKNWLEVGDGIFSDVCWETCREVFLMWTIAQAVFWRSEGKLKSKTS